ncbi:heat-inducible transcriptional repressor HrcA [Mycoplasmopsis ciconiae]|uniref:Heat-inducible transcription repressor HrcA n=1 Tax=Mycoplasmopsis ciconiae TaxID=561067 RepID=A0ABU7MNC9_9BACT|nr:heat-inducible transcriptional repressor HrcA [Mycoplasmopsis ciconiae]
MNRIKAAHEQILKCVTEIYVEEAKSVSSSYILEKYNLDMSSAKIRYLMSDLEDNGLLEKTHISSGRIPTIKGLEYYAKFLSSENSLNVHKQLRKIFDQRRDKVDNTIEQAAKIISEATGMTVITKIDQSNKLLKSIQLVPISDFSATIVLVISSGEVFSKFINIKDAQENEDLRVAIRLFKERLIDTPLSQLSNKVVQLKDILASAIKNYEDILENFVTNIFNINCESQNKVYGKNNIVLCEQIPRSDLNHILSLIENQSIWELIEENVEEEENLKISINNTAAFISKRLKTNDQINEISIVAANNSDFKKMRGAIILLENLLKEKEGKK